MSEFDALLIKGGERLKITITIKDKPDSNSCEVKIKPQKDLSKASKTEKTTGFNIYNTICNALKDLEKEGK